MKATITINGTQVTINASPAEILAVAERMGIMPRRGPGRPPEWQRRLSAVSPASPESPAS